MTPGSLRPVHGFLIPEGDVPDRCLTDPPGGVGEERVVEAAFVGAAQQLGLGDLADVLEVWQVALVGHRIQGQWTGRGRGGVGDPDQHFEFGGLVRGLELTRAGADATGQREIVRSIQGGEREEFAYPVVGEVRPEQLDAGVAQSCEMQVQSPDRTVADLHGREVGVPGEGEGSEVGGGGAATVEEGLGDRHDGRLGVDTSGKGKRGWDVVARG